MRKCERVALLVFFMCAGVGVARSAGAVQINYRLYSASATMGPEAQVYAAKLQDITGVALGVDNEVSFQSLGVAPIPSTFVNIMAAVGAGAAKGGFDAAYISGGDLNKAWGFIYNSGVPFGPTYDEFIGFLLGKSVNGQITGLELAQSILDKNGKNVIAVPIVSSSEQSSGFFSLPVGNVPGKRGIGLAGLCQQPWTFRYLPPAENVLGIACDNLVAAGAIPAKNIKFISAVPGNGSLIDGVKAGTLQAFEFATPFDDVSQLFNTQDNPGTVGLRYMHEPGWHQQFLITYMLINKQVWAALTPGQQALVQSVGRDHLIASYGESMQQQGAALKYILDINRQDKDRKNDIIIAKWPQRDLARMRDATIQYLNARVNDASLSAADRQDYATVLEALRTYVQSNDLYWDERDVSTQMRFEGWTNAAGQSWGDKDHDCRSED